MADTLVQNRDVLIIPCWRRPEFLWHCLDNLRRAEGIGDLHVLVSSRGASVTRSRCRRIARNRAPNVRDGGARFPALALRGAGVAAAVVLLDRRAQHQPRGAGGRRPRGLLRHDARLLLARRVLRALGDRAASISRMVCRARWADPAHPGGAGGAPSDTAARFPCRFLGDRRDQRCPVRIARSARPMPPMRPCLAKRARSRNLAPETRRVRAYGACGVTPERSEEKAA